MDHIEQARLAVDAAAKIMDNPRLEPHEKADQASPLALIGIGRALIALAEQRA